MHGLLLDGYIDLRTYTDTQLMAYIAGWGGPALSMNGLGDFVWQVNVTNFLVE